MEIFTSKSALAEFLNSFREAEKTIGFVPTMGALHQGHISLVKIAKELTDLVVCSIFVNPTQFTDPNDLDKYPRPVSADTALLNSAECDVLFLPEVSEMYSGAENWKLDIGYLETILEGKFRPGHYQGVTQIVKKFIDVVQPDFMFMGQKDYQQVLVLEQMIKILKLPTELVMCPIVRESDGLALSSRNIHLSEKERKQAVILSLTLNAAKQDFAQKPIDELKQDAWQDLSHAEGIVPEYFEICDGRTLLPVQNANVESIVALVAAKVGNTRLIDNIILK